jgi:hypothetical protein
MIVRGKARKSATVHRCYLHENILLQWSMRDRPAIGAFEHPVDRRAWMIRQFAIGSPDRDRDFMNAYLDGLTERAWRGQDVDVDSRSSEATFDLGCCLRISVRREGHAAHVLSRPAGHADLAGLEAALMKRPALDAPLRVRIARPRIARRHHEGEVRGRSPRHSGDQRADRPAIDHDLQRPARRWCDPGPDLLGRIDSRRRGSTHLGPARTSSSCEARHDRGDDHRSRSGEPVHVVQVSPARW